MYPAANLECPDLRLLVTLQRCSSTKIIYAEQSISLNLIFSSYRMIFFRTRRKLWVYHCLSHGPDLALWSYHIWRKRCLGTSHRESDLGQFTVMWEQQEQGMVQIISGIILKISSSSRWVNVKMKAKSGTLNSKPVLLETCACYTHDKAALELQMYLRCFKTTSPVACFTVYFLQQLN